jgi:Uma2 family endonuclease
MTALLAPEPPRSIVYPESDGKRMADNTEQARWIFVLFGNLETLLAEVLAFVAADLMWYGKEGFPEECEAPDVFVALGRPKGKRPSYKQWEEGDVGPQVVFEVLSPSNTPQEMERKDAFYTEYGVEEYYIYNPEKDTLEVYLRKGSVLRRQWFQGEFVSPLLGIRFDLTGEEMQVFYPDGRRFLSFSELEAERARERQLRLDAEQKLQTTEQKLQTTEQKLQTTEQRAARLTELSRKLVQQQATAEEIAELQQLVGPAPPA